MTKIELTQDENGMWQAEWPGGTEIKTGQTQDEYYEELWEQLGNIPVTEDGEELDQDFLFFTKGSSKWDVWHWFDERHSKGVAWLMNADGKRYAEESDK